jgi:hypothetical protein
MSSNSETKEVTETETKEVTGTDSPPGWFNFGGPGWINDVFDLKVTLDNDRKTVIRNALFAKDANVYLSTEVVTGQLRVTAPPGLKVWHWGIKLECECSISFFETLSTIDVATVKVDVAPEGYLEGAHTFDFELALPTSPASYDGDFFAIRHSVIATIVRSWYTFDVMQQLPIAVQELSPAPEAGVEFKGELGVSKITLPDCGNCFFDFGRAMLNINETMEGTLVFSGMPSPIVAANVLLYKIESGMGSADEIVIAEYHCVGNQRLSVAKESDENFQTTDITLTTPDGSIFEGGAIDSEQTLCVKIDLSQLYLEPTISSLAIPHCDDPVSVLYYLRLYALDHKGRKCWNTVEIKLFRAEITITPATTEV